MLTPRLTHSWRAVKYFLTMTIESHSPAVISSSIQSSPEALTTKNTVRTMESSSCSAEDREEQNSVGDKDVEAPLQQGPPSLPSVDEDEEGYCPIVDSKERSILYRQSSADSGMSGLTEDVTTTTMATLQSKLQDSEAEMQKMKEELDALQKGKDADKRIEQELQSAKKELESLKKQLQAPPPPPPLSNDDDDDESSIGGDSFADESERSEGVKPVSKNLRSSSSTRREMMKRQRSVNKLKSTREEIIALKLRLRDNDNEIASPPAPPLYMDMDGTAHGAPSISGSVPSEASRNTSNTYPGRQPRSSSPKTMARVDQRKNQIRARQSSLDSPKYGTVAEDSLDASFNITRGSGFKSRSQKPGKHNSYTAGMDSLDASFDITRDSGVKSRRQQPGKHNSYTAGMHASFAQGMSQSMHDKHRSYTAGIGLSKSPVPPKKKPINRISGWKSPMEVPATTPSAPKRKVRLSAKEKETLLGPGLGKSPTRKNRQTIGNSPKTPTRKSSKSAAAESKPGPRKKRSTSADRMLTPPRSVQTNKKAFSHTMLDLPVLELEKSPKRKARPNVAMNSSPLRSSKPKLSVPVTTPSAPKQKVRLSRKDQDALKGPVLSRSPKPARKSKASANKKSTNSPKITRKTTGTIPSKRSRSSEPKLRGRSESAQPLSQKRTLSVEKNAPKRDRLTVSNRSDHVKSKPRTGSSRREQAQDTLSSSNRTEDAKPKSKPPSRPRPKLAGYRQGSIFFGKKEIKITPASKSVVIIWILMSLELILDLVTSFIAFTVFIEDPAYCCGESVKQGALPLATTIPFFFLIIAELTFLLRAVTLTLWPKVVTGEADDEEMDGSQRHLYKRVCCCITWNAKYIMWIINFLTIVNPFFSFLIAWTLMYLSSKRESFMVMGLEGATIVLHYLAVWYEGSAKTLCLKCLHAMILVPFFGTIIMTVWYLQQGGICYDASIDRFWYKGCEVCEDGVPPVNGTLCPTVFLINGQNVTTYESLYLWELNRTSLCTDEYRFCFYEY